MLEKNIKSLLVIKTRAMGDTLLATPALRALRQALPEVRITVVVAPPGHDILQDNPDVNELLVYDKSIPGLNYFLRFVGELRQRKFDAVIALHASFRTALLAWLSGAPIRVVHNHSGSNFLANRRILAPKESKSAIERDLDAVRALGFPSIRTGLVFPVLPKHTASVAEFLRVHHLENSKHLFLLAPGAGKARKRWTAEACAAFLDHISQRLDSDWILLVGPGETEMASEIQQRMKWKLPIFNRSIQEAGALMAHCRGMVTADSGPKHVGVAMGVPTLTLWTDEPEAEWHPYDLAQHGLIRSRTGIVADIPAEDVVAAVVEKFKLDPQ